MARVGREARIPVGSAHTSGHHAIVRAAVPGDASEIAEVFLASRHDALPYLPTIHSDEETRRWIPDIVMRHSEVWVAELHGKIVGFVSVAGEHLDHLYIRPGYYRQGIGDRLLAQAKAMSPRRLRLFTFQRNERARAFYEARGFVPVDFNDGSRNEEREPDILYEWVASRAGPR
jgi:ribosomal protein S18 acetylase RimI-like enzyme